MLSIVARKEEGWVDLRSWVGGIDLFGTFEAIQIKYLIISVHLEVQSLN